jgi:hypothetical protein
MRDADWPRNLGSAGPTKIFRCARYLPSPPNFLANTNRNRQNEDRDVLLLLFAGVSEQGHYIRYDRPVS